MPLYNIQRLALEAIAGNRHQGSHIAGGTVINIRGARFSKDIDIFHDLSNNDERVRLLSEAVEADVISLEAAGFEVKWDLKRPEFYRAVIEKDGEKTVLEWVVDSDFRFFDSVPDETFGFRLHIFDLATNKVLAAASRKEPRDVVDLLYIHKNCFSLAAAIWAAPTKDPGYTPESLIEDLRRNCIYRQEDFDRVISNEKLDAREISISLKLALKQAEDFFARMPPGYEGVAFLEGDRPTVPDVSRLDEYKIVEARRQLHWPSSSDIDSEMIVSTPKP